MTGMIGSIGYMSDIYSFFASMLTLLAGMLWLTVPIVIILLLVPYALTGYAVMLTGRKAGLDTDWMAYIPIARQLYQMQIARCPWWYIFLFKEGTAHNVILILLSQILFAGVRGLSVAFTVFGLIILLAYVVASLVFTFFYYREFYQRFGFHKYTAFIEIVWTTEFIGTIFQMYIAFSRSVKYREGTVEDLDYLYSSQGAAECQDDGRTVALHQMSPQEVKRPAKITGIAGKYAGASFDVADGEEVIFGRSAAEANIVFDQYETDISRRHCSVRYDAMSDQFVVTDYSTNGTYAGDGRMFTPKQAVSVERGTIIYLGKNRKNSFRLG